MDNRLDFINNFIDHDLAIATMVDARKQFIELDKYLRGLAASKINDGAFARCVSLARTNLEQSLQYTIKALCLLHEDKPE